MAETKIGGYIRGQGLLCIAVGTAAFIAYLLIGPLMQQATKPVLACWLPVRLPGGT